MAVAAAIGLWAALVAHAVQGDVYRLLSVTETSKMILVSHPTTKTRYLLDAEAAKITVDGKPAEFKALRMFSIVRVKFDARKQAKGPIEVDGVAREIAVVTGETIKTPPPK
jgi:hypothetical protein